MKGEQSPSFPQCPYGDKPCPKVDGIEKDLKETKRSLEDMKKILYVIAGVLMVQLGVTII